MKILISGSGGTVGQAVIQELLSCYPDAEVYALTSRIESLRCHNQNLHKVENKDIENLMQAIPFDVLLHLAFPRNVDADRWAAGIEFSSKVLSLAKKHDVKRIIHVSSQSIYGWQREKKASESSKIFLTSPYTTGKYCTELFVNALFDDRPATNIRLSTIIGPATEERVVNKFFSRIAAHENITVRGGGQIFSFLDVRDAASGLVRLIRSDGTKWRPVYNLGTEESESLLSIAQMAVKIGEKYGYQETQILMEKDDIVMNNRLDVSAFSHDFQWTAAHCLMDTMEYIFRSVYMK